MTKQKLASQENTASLIGNSQQKFAATFRTPEDLATKVHHMSERMIHFLSPPAESIVEYRNIVHATEYEQFAGEDFVLSSLTLTFLISTSLTPSQ